MTRPNSVNCMTRPNFIIYDVSVLLLLHLSNFQHLNHFVIGCALHLKWYFVPWRSLEEIACLNVPTSPGPSTLGLNGVVVLYNGAPLSVLAHAICTKIGLDAVPPVFESFPQTT